MSTENVKKIVKGIDLSGLDNFNVSSLMEAGSPKALVESNGKPLELGLREIVEDPDQPRSAENPGFTQASLLELAQSITESKGVKTPISVRSKNAAGMYIINHGARRFRASVLGGFQTIKAFIDDVHDEYDQAIENIQRENFTPMEVALFIDKRERLGESRSAISKRIGKSKTFVTQHASLLALPPELRQVYDDARCRDVLALYELGNLNKKSPQAVAEFLMRTPEITRAAVESLKAATKEVTLATALASENEENTEGAARPSKPTKVGNPLIMVKHENRIFILRADKRPSALHLGWIENTETGDVVEVELSELTLDSIVER